MNTINYMLLLKWLLSFALLYLFYKAILQNTTFYKTNRFYLLLGSVVCFILPLLHFPVLHSDSQQNHLFISMVNSVPAVNDLAPNTTEISQTTKSTINLPTVVNLIYWIGVLIFSIRLVIILSSFYKIRKQAMFQYDLGKAKLYTVPSHIPSFSFGNKIFINASNFDDKQNLSQIEIHEYNHVRQLHTMDILWMELLTVLNWFNPFVWLLKSLVRNNLEFLVDAAVLKNSDTDKKSYQYLLLNTMAKSHLKTSHTLTNNFNISSLKKRIVMMNTKSSSKWQYLNFLLLIPILAFLTMSFRNNKKNPYKFVLAGIIVDSATRQPLPNIEVSCKEIDQTATTDDRGYYLMQSDKNIPYGSSITVSLKKKVHTPTFSFGQTIDLNKKTYTGVVNFIIGKQTSDVMGTMTNTDYSNALSFLNKDIDNKKNIEDFNQFGEIITLKNNRLYVIIGKTGSSNGFIDLRDGRKIPIILVDKKPTSIEEVNKMDRSIFNGFKITEDTVWLQIAKKNVNYWESKD